MFELKKEGRGVNREGVQRLMRVMASRRWFRAPARAKPRLDTNLSLSAARPGDRRAEPRVGGRHHLHPDGARLSVSGGDHGLGQPRCSAGGCRTR